MAKQEIKIKIATNYFELHNPLYDLVLDWNNVKVRTLLHNTNDVLPTTPNGFTADYNYELTMLDGTWSFLYDDIKAAFAEALDLDVDQIQFNEVKRTEYEIFPDFHS